MSPIERLGRKGRGDVRIELETGRVVYLTAFEVRSAYRELYREGTRKRAAAPIEEESEIERSARLGAPT